MIDNGPVLPSRKQFQDTIGSTVPQEQDEELVLAADFVSWAEAKVACGLLRSCGIAAVLKDSMHGNSYSNWAHADEEGRLLFVPRSSLADAQELLKTGNPEG